MTDVREAHTQFESVKVAMTQDKNGHVLKLSIHPSDTPESIMRDPVGTRYMVVLVRIGEEGQPVASQSDEEGRRAIMVAGTLCRDEAFQEFMARKGYAEDASEQAATTALRHILKITSRKELKTDREARQRLLDLKAEFVEALRQGQQYR